MPDPTRAHPERSFPTADPPRADTRSVGEPTLDPAASPAEPAPDLPAAPPGYELLAEIGRGGMGVVYRGRDTSLNRDVAVKLLQSRYSLTSLAARRFVDEAKITGQLQHPGIPPVHEVGELPDGRPYLVMKLIKGKTLADMLKEVWSGHSVTGFGRSGHGVTGPQPANRGSLIAVFEQVCQAVAYAHNHGVVHRDLKPANVMVGAFGEVQVMDWGLAKFRSETRADSAEATSASTFHDPRSEEDEDLHTRAGSFLGTPAFMSPEQAIGAVDQIDERSDVFGLGAVLCAILTGAPPFVADTGESTRQLSAQKALDPAFARLDGCGAEPGLVALCKRCLAGERSARYRNAGEVAAAVHAIRAEVEERARRAELDAVRAEGERQKAELQAAEELKRRRLRLSLAAFVVMVVFGGVSVGVWVVVQGNRDKFAAEQKRQADLQAADEAERQRMREAEAESLVRALATAEPGAVRVYLNELARYREEARPHLLALSKRPGGDRAGLRARLALRDDMNVNPGAVDGSFLPTLVNDAAECPPEDLPLILARSDAGVRRILTDGFWKILTDWPPGQSNHPLRFRLTTVLVLLAPDSGQPKALDEVADGLVWLNPLEAEPFARALHPVRHQLVGPLRKRYSDLRTRIESGKLPAPELVAEASAFDLAANLLARYTADRPTELAELAVIVDARHYKLFAESIQANRAAVVPLLKAELARPVSAPQWALDGLGPPLAGVVGLAAVSEWLNPDAVLAEQGKRRGYAAAVLLALGEAESVWPLFQFPKDGDPTARSYLIQRLAGIGAYQPWLMKRFEVEPDVSAQRALLIALGDRDSRKMLDVEEEALSVKLLKLYREHPDSGLHSAIDWLLRQKWGKAAEVAAIDAELARLARAKVMTRGLAGAVSPGPFGAAVGPQLPAPSVAQGKDWFVNGEGQTFAVVRGPVEFTMGSPLSEPGRFEGDEHLHPKRISRTFAVATKEVTVAEFLRFRPKHDWFKRYSPGPDTPAMSLTWYDCAEYCNWLSEREGIPPDQWCYEPNEKDEYAEGMRMKAGHLKLTGYRLPTEAEWEYACRSGALTSWYYGRGEELLPRYGWFAKNTEDRARPVGRLRPNERGLFDALGNAREWCEDPGFYYTTSQREDIESVRSLLIDERLSRPLRGGTLATQPVYMRCASRFLSRPGSRGIPFGFRPVRTLP